MKKAAGLVIIYDNPNEPTYEKDGIRLLLVHPTNSPWVNSWSIPKGIIKDGESTIIAALRETYEETGIRILRSYVYKEKPYKVVFFDKDGNITKKIYYYYVFVNNLKKLRMTNYFVQRSRLELDEIDRARFMTLDEAKIKMNRKFRPLLIQVDRFKQRDWKF